MAMSKARKQANRVMRDRVKQGVSADGVASRQSILHRLTGKPDEYFGVPAVSNHHVLDLGFMGLPPFVIR